MSADPSLIKHLQLSVRLPPRLHYSAVDPFGQMGMRRSGGSGITILALRTGHCGFAPAKNTTAITHITRRAAKGLR